MFGVTKAIRQTSISVLGSSGVSPELPLFLNGGDWKKLPRHDFSIGSEEIKKSGGVYFLSNACFRQAPRYIPRGLLN